MSETWLRQEADCWRGGFQAMASPCEVLMELDDAEMARRILDAVEAEALRIEHKFSRYRSDNIIYKINNAEAELITVDDETARLLDFADELYRLSEGLFDITSGVLRKVWKFDGSDNVPKQDEIDAVLDYVGWQKARWRDRELWLPAGMEIDLGGIGKEYAVDRCVQIVRAMTEASVLINFGGDLAVSRERRQQDYWSVGRLVTGKDSAVAFFKLYRGAIATSGDAHRYLLKEAVRYSHVLDPCTGWSVPGAPHTVSVAAPSCTEAGMLASFAMLQGEKASTFLEAQKVKFWID